MPRWYQYSKKNEPFEFHGHGFSYSLTMIQLLLTILIAPISACRSTSFSGNSGHKNQLTNKERAHPETEPDPEPTSTPSPKDSQNSPNDNVSSDASPIKVVPDQPNPDLPELADGPAKLPDNTTGAFLTSFVVHTLSEPTDQDPELHLGCVIVNDTNDVTSKLKDANYGCELKGSFSAEHFDVTYLPQASTDRYHVIIVIRAKADQDPVTGSARTDILDAMTTATMVATRQDPQSGVVQEIAAASPPADTGLFPAPDEVLPPEGGQGTPQ